MSKKSNRNEKLLKRDRGRCQCCSRKLNEYSMTTGHRVAKAIYNSNELPNLQLECFQCNQQKCSLNKKYLRNARKFRKDGSVKLMVSVHSVTYDRVENEGNLHWFEDRGLILEKNDEVMIGDFAILKQ